MPQQQQQQQRQQKQSSSSKEIAQAFLKQYFTCLHNSPQEMHFFYNKNEKTISRVTNNKTKDISFKQQQTNAQQQQQQQQQQQKKTLTSADEINQHFINNESHYLDCSTEIMCLDQSDTFLNGNQLKLICVKGFFETLRNRGKKYQFSQTFLLTKVKDNSSSSAKLMYRRQAIEFVILSEIVSIMDAVNVSVSTRDYPQQQQEFNHHQRHQQQQTTDLPSPPSQRSSSGVVAIDTKKQQQQRQEQEFFEKQLSSLSSNGGADKQQQQHKRFDNSDDAESETQAPTTTTAASKTTKHRFGVDQALVDAKNKLRQELKESKPSSSPSKTSSFGGHEGNRGGGGKPRATDQHVIFIKNISVHTPASAIRREFGAFGEIQGLDFGFPKEVFAVEEKKKFCFLSFSSREECDMAVSNNAKLYVDGRRLLVQHRSGKASNSTHQAA